MSEYSDQRDAIMETIGGITDIGRLHDRPRNGDARHLWVTEIDGIEQVRAWELGLRDPGPTRERLTGGGHVHTYRHWQIRGWFSLVEPQDLLGEGAEGNDDYDSDWVGDNYIEIEELGQLIADALEDNRPLSSVANPSGTCIELTLTPQITDPEALALGGGHLCWSIAIDFDAYTIKNPSRRTQMSRKDELKDQARALGLSTNGTIAELEQQIDDALTGEDAIKMRYVGDSARRFPRMGIVEPGDFVILPRINLQSKLFEPAAGEESTNGEED